MRILQINTTDHPGGAAAIATALLRSYRLRGHESELAVGVRATHADGIVDISGSGAWARGRRAAAAALAPPDGVSPGVGRLLLALPWVLAEPRRAQALRLGREDFDFPATAKIVGRLEREPDLLHAHNLHGGYFDLRALAALSQRYPFFVTLHDTWMLSGHCAYTLGCERWKIGCGRCPDLSIYPAIPGDATAFNWRRKQEIYSQSRLHVAAPSRWLLEKAERSILAPGIVDTRVIPHGVDTDLFRPGDRMQARRSLSLPSDARIAMIAASGLRESPFKDLAFLRSALAAVESPLLVLAVGGEGPAERCGAATIRFVPFQQQEALAVYYQAADVLLHGGRPESENFPNVVLEALASGLPVVAKHVGGVPEQIVEGETGILVGDRDARGFAQGVDALVTDASLRTRMGEAAVADVSRRFTLTRMTEAYLDWYADALAGADARARR